MILLLAQSASNGPDLWSIIALVLGAIGAAGGIVGALAARGVYKVEKRRDEPRLRLTATNGAFGQPETGLTETVAVTILNLSNFAVWINDITLVNVKPDGSTEYLFYPHPKQMVTSDLQPLRRELKARRSMSVFLPSETTDGPNPPTISHIRVRTECGLEERLEASELFLSLFTSKQERLNKKENAPEREREVESEWRV